MILYRAVRVPSTGFHHLSRQTIHAARHAEFRSPWVLLRMLRIDEPVFSCCLTKPRPASSDRLRTRTFRQEAPQDLFALDRDQLFRPVVRMWRQMTEVSIEPQHRRLVCYIPNDYH